MGHALQWVEHVDGARIRADQRSFKASNVSSSVIKRAWTAFGTRRPGFDQSTRALLAALLDLLTGGVVFFCTKRESRQKVQENKP